MDIQLTKPAAPGRARSIRRFQVTVLDGSKAGTVWAEAQARCGIGSHPSNDLIVDDPTVSRFHCEITIAGDRLRVRDLGSRNGTKLGDVLLDDARLPDAVVLMLGHTRIEVSLGHDRAEIAESSKDQFGGVIGGGTAMRELFAQLERIAQSDATVLIEGETGTGKEGVADAIHVASPRSKGPCVVVDCSAIPANLLESELFGHEAGAFTGASSLRIGAFEEASGGTLFLDEIGELPLDLQPKLLRALEAREIRRVGGRGTIRCDLRVIAATNRDLRAEVNRGHFRADLYYRLAVVKIWIPPLRERADDLPLLVPHLLRRIGAGPATLEALTQPTYLAQLARAPWPGNVRELRNHLEQCVVFDEARTPRAEAAQVEAMIPAHPGEAQPYDLARRHALDAFERAYVTALLARHDQNVAKAAREAGLNRAYLHRLLSRHGLR